MVPSTHRGVPGNIGLQQRLKYLVHAEIVCVTGVLIVRVDRLELHPKLACNDLAHRHS